MKHAVIGTGYWGSNHVRVATELKAEGVLDDVLLCDMDEERAAEMAESFGLDYVTTVNEIPDRGIDTATVATPSPTHHEIATSMLDAGIDLLVEKPLALTSEDAWAIVDAAERNNCTLGVGHIFRYHPALRELKRRMDRGEFGTVRTMYSTRFAFREPRATAGALYSLGVHDIDVSNFLLDRPPERLFCALETHIREDTDEAATLVLDYDGVRSIITESWQVPVFDKRRDLIVVGSEKVAYLDYLEDTTVEVFESRVEEKDGTLMIREEGRHEYKVPDEEPLRTEVCAFLEASRNGEDPIASGTVGAQAVELLELAERSAESFETVDTTDLDYSRLSE